MKKSKFVTFFSVSFLALTFFLTFSLPNASADTEMLPAGSPGWVGDSTDGATPLGGTMPFGNQIGSGPGGWAPETCGASYNFNTLWLGNPDVPLIATSHTITLPAGTTNLVVHVAIDNDVKVLVNGFDISGGLTIHDGCATHYNAEYTAPDGDLLVGTNTITIVAKDRGVVDYLDAEVTAKTPTTSVPEFPIPFSMIIIFAAVAAVYMGVRQKMIPGFKSF